MKPLTPSSARPLKPKSLLPSAHRLAFALTATAASLLLGATAYASSADSAKAPELKTLLIAAQAQQSQDSRDAVVEAQRQTVVAAQVAGAIVQMEVKVGDRVSAGQVLMRIDARQAEQNTQASEAQAQAARAQGLLAAREFERQQQLFKQNYISQAALDQAEAQYKATQAQVQAQLAQVGVARTQSGFSIVRSPYAGVVADVPVTLGDMAMPGRALATIYDPTALRITTHLPQNLSQSLSRQLQALQSAGSPAQGQIRIELPGLGAAGRNITPSQIQILPTVDAASLTQELRLDLPAGLSGVVPGMFARVLWSTASLSKAPAGVAGKAGLAEPAPAPFLVPRSALLRRAELMAVYVLDSKGQPLLRQVRVGKIQGDQQEVLSGLNAGERLVLNPQAAASKR
ncbi:efflux RND transporter periplasmic adaptor subunit [Roseateles sp.]|uniref:efflux RND transporter periplasmic adaptor subunit n=1 Tax=Roseateles sp. TaxID=1971397 RepID=UPI003BA48FDD